ncbi:MAG: TIGR00730 family Rossman fold protein [Anaerolineales bacterium]|nr:MAG: TIGR00730 family Rossman fold protein [Anaerolineales bacterium]
MRICVYCSSSSAVDRIYYSAARELGLLIASRGHSLIYGGGHSGPLGELARAVKAAGSRVVGVIPRSMKEMGLAYEQADEMIVTESMAERKAHMEQNADAFVALPGGFGTLEELTQVITMKQLNYVSGAIVVLNVAGFYDQLLSHFERIRRQRFAGPQSCQLYHVVASPSEALDYLESHRGVSLRSRLL